MVGVIMAGNPEPDPADKPASSPVAAKAVRGRKAASKGKGRAKKRPDPVKASEKAEKAKERAKAKRAREADKRAAVRQRKAEREQTAKEKRRRAARVNAEEERRREIDRRLAARARAAKEREQSRWEKKIDEKAYKACWKRLAAIWEPNLKYRFVPRAGVAPEEMPVIKAAEKRAFRDYKRYRANMRRDPQAVRYDEVAAKAAMFLRNHFPGWIMDDAIIAAVWRIWKIKAGDSVKRNASRWEAYKVWQDLSETVRHRAILLDLARKWNVNMTREEADQLVPKFMSVSDGARYLFSETGEELAEFSRGRMESDIEVYDRILESDGLRRAAASNPLDALIEAETLKAAFDSLDDRERVAVEMLSNGATQEKVKAELGIAHKSQASALVAGIREKIAHQLQLPLEQCRFKGRAEKSKDNYKPYILSMLNGIRDNRRTDMGPALVKIIFS